MIKCGNKKVHGKEFYHNSVADVRECYRQRYQPEPVKPKMTFDLDRNKVVPNYGLFPRVNVEILPSIPAEERDGESECRYCHAVGTITYSQHAWHDQWECSRCGGQDAYAIGD